MTTYTTSICQSQRPPCCDHTWPYPNWKALLDEGDKRRGIPLRPAFPHVDPTTMVHRCDHDVGHTGPHTCGCGTQTP